MIPEDIMQFEEEMYVQVGASSLPVSEAMEDTNNLDTLAHFLFLLHRGRCFGRTELPDELHKNTECIETVSCFEFFQFVNIRAYGEQFFTPNFYIYELLLLF